MSSNINTSDNNSNAAAKALVLYEEIPDSALILLISGSQNDIDKLKLCHNKFVNSPHCEEDTFELLCGFQYHISLIRGESLEQANIACDGKNNVFPSITCQLISKDNVDCIQMTTPIAIIRTGFFL